MSWSESKLQYEHGKWVIRLGPCFVVLLDADEDLLNLCPGAAEKREWVLNQPF